MIYIFDLDNTLCKDPPLGADIDWPAHYVQAESVQDAINKLNALFGQNNRIIIHTARPECDRKITERWLDKHKVRYHKLIMDKPRGDIYVDNDARRIDEL